MTKRQITIKDIAKALSISPSTVSRSLADHPDISRETKNMVLAYAKEHKYKPNPLATSLRTNQSKTIGVILPEIVHFFFATVLSGIEDEAEKEGFRILVSHTREEYKKEVRAAQTMLEARVSGVLASVAKSTEEYDHFQELIDNDIPLVFFDRICRGILTDRVVVDDYNGACSAVNYLIETGCRRVAFFGSPSQLAISNNRRMGYEDALIKNKMQVDPELIIICDNYADALEMTEKMLSLPNPPDAFFAVNDETAIGILNKAKALGYRVPEDISVCGFTNNSICEISEPSLTSVDQHGYEVGAMAMRLLLDHINGKREDCKVISKIIKTKLIRRQTTR
jgi:LacI family transcriptional regulator